MELIPVRNQQHIRCPNCGKVGPWLQSSYFPFCSLRCKQLDLYKWFTEQYVISDNPSDEVRNSPDNIELDFLTKKLPETNSEDN